MPPPDMVFDGPSVMSNVAPEKSNRYTDATKLMPVESVEHGTELDSMGRMNLGVLSQQIKVHHNPLLMYLQAVMKVLALLQQSRF